MTKNNLVDEMKNKVVEEYKLSVANEDYAKELKKKAKKNGRITPFNQLSPEARSYNARLGGLAKQEKRRKTLILSETMQMLMQMPLANEDEIRNILLSKGLDSEMLTEATAICYTQLQRAKQDSKAFEVVRDTIGQKPVERQVVLSNQENPADIIKKHFGEDI